MPSKYFLQNACEKHGWWVLPAIFGFKTMIPARFIVFLPRTIGGQPTLMPQTRFAGGSPLLFHKRETWCGFELTLGSPGNIFCQRHLLQ